MTIAPSRVLRDPQVIRIIPLRRAIVSNIRTAFVIMRAVFLANPGMRERKPVR